VTNAAIRAAVSVAPGHADREADEIFTDYKLQHSQGWTHSKAVRFVENAIPVYRPELRS
jgi:hypothetical protein